MDEKEPGDEDISNRPWRWPWQVWLVVGIYLVFLNVVFFHEMLSHKTDYWLFTVFRGVFGL